VLMKCRSPKVRGNFGNGYSIFSKGNNITH